MCDCKRSSECGVPCFRSTLYGATTEASSNRESWRNGLVCDSHDHAKKVRPSLRGGTPVVGAASMGTGAFS